jgi:rod shape determining protein RodA
MKIKFQRENFDIWLFISALSLSLLGLLLVYSASRNVSLPPESHLFSKQVIWLLLGLILGMVFFVVPLKLHDFFSGFYYLIGIGLLLLLDFVGNQRGGAVRWFDFKGLAFQPSEFFKLAFVFVLARYLAYSRRSFMSFRWLSTVFILTLIPVGLILKQPDLATSLVFIVILVVMFFWAGVLPLYILLLFTPFISLIAAFHLISWAIFFFLVILLLYYLRPNFLLSSSLILFNILFGIANPLVWNRLHDYQKLRIIAFFDPTRDPQGAGYQIIQSKVAIGSGGFLGKGFLHGSQTKLAFLPAQHTDFIFSVLGEEFGFWGVLVLLALFFVLFLKGFTIARKARNSFASFVALGISSVLAFQVIVNIGMATGAMPVAGLPLPFVSYGGSSMLLAWACIGILLNINYHWYEY